jgi:hypothetical protein
MTTLIGAGCSFTLGSELQDDNDGLRKPSNYSWAAILAKKLNMDYYCVANPGISNQSIARQLFDSIIEKQTSNLAVAVMWTFTSRYEIFSKTQWKSVSNQTRLIDNDIDKWYEICGDSEIYEIYTSLTSYLMIQELLERKKIPYLFTSADVCIWDRFFYKNPDTSIKSLQKEINWNNWYWIGERKQGFFEWGSKYPVGPYLHPLEQAHNKLVDDMLPKALTLLQK